MARRLYAAIGHQVARNAHDSVTTRARVPARRKLLLAGQSLWAASRTPDASFAAARSPPRQPHPGWEDRLIWLLTLFSELDQRQARG